MCIYGYCVNSSGITHRHTVTVIYYHICRTVVPNPLHRVLPSARIQEEVEYLGLNLGVRLGVSLYTHHTDRL